MLKKIIASTVAAGLLAGNAVAASAAPIAFESANRAASPVASAEQMEEMSEAWLVLLFAAIAAAIILLVEGSEGTELPTSP